MGINFRLAGAILGGVVVLAVIGIIAKQAWDIRGLKNENEIYAINEKLLQDAVKTQSKTIAYTQQRLESEQVNSAHKQREINQAQAQNDAMRRALTKANERLTNVAIIKPTSVERIINNATRSLMHEFSEETRNPNISDTATTAGSR